MNVNWSDSIKKMNEWYSKFTDVPAGHCGTAWEHEQFGPVISDYAALYPKDKEQLDRIEEELCFLDRKMERVLDALYNRRP